MLEFAAREGIAVAGVTGFPGREVYSKLGRHILDGLAAMGARGHHPELAEPGRYGWLPNEGLARLYQANATRSRPLQLALADAGSQPAAGTSGVYLSAGLGTRVDPGQVVRLKVTAKPLLRGITKVAILDRGRKVAEADLSKGGECTLKIDGTKTLYALYAHAVQQSFTGEAVERISPPLQLLVRDPKTSARIAAQLAPLEFAASARARAVAPVPDTVDGEISEKDTLRA